MAMAETDQKAGFCSNCRRGDHTMCASPKCTCPDSRRHRNRPGYAAVEGTAPAAPISNLPRPAAPAGSGVAVGGGMVWEEPPGRSRGPSEILTPEQIELRNHPMRWARVHTFKGETSANSLAAKIRNGKTTLDPKVWEALGRRRDGGSALYVRFVGGQAPDAS